MIEGGSRFDSKGRDSNRGSIQRGETHCLTPWVRTCSSHGSASTKEKVSFCASFPSAHSGVSAGGAGGAGGAAASAAADALPAVAVPPVSAAPPRRRWMVEMWAPRVIASATATTSSRALIVAEGESERESEIGLANSLPLLGMLKEGGRLLYLL